MVGIWEVSDESRKSIPEENLIFNTEIMIKK